MLKLEPSLIAALLLTKARGNDVYTVYWVELGGGMVVLPGQAGMCVVEDEYHILILQYT